MKKFLCALLLTVMLAGAAFAETAVQGEVALPAETQAWSDTSIVINMGDVLAPRYVYLGEVTAAENTVFQGLYVLMNDPSVCVMDFAPLAADAPYWYYSVLGAMNSPEGAMGYYEDYGEDILPGFAITTPVYTTLEEMYDAPWADGRILGYAIMNFLEQDASGNAVTPYQCFLAYVQTQEVYSFGIMIQSRAGMQLDENACLAELERIIPAIVPAE